MRQTCEFNKKDKVRYQRLKRHITLYHAKERRGKTRQLTVQQFPFLSLLRKGWLSFFTLSQCLDLAHTGSIFEEEKRRDVFFSILHSRECIGLRNLSPKRNAMSSVWHVSKILSINAVFCSLVFVTF